MLATRRIIIAAASAASLLAPAPAVAGMGGTCSLDAAVTFDAGGRMVPAGTGSITCAGTLGEQSVDPIALPVTLSGQARRGAAACAPELVHGRLATELRPLISFDAHPGFAFGADWVAVASSGLPVAGITGEAYANGVAMPFSGAARFLPSGACDAGWGTGTVHFDLVFGEGRRSTSTASKEASTGPPETSPEPAAAPPKRRCACRKTSATRRRCGRGYRRCACRRDAAGRHRWLRRATGKRA